MADGLALLDHVDSRAGLRNALRDVAAVRERWAGIPMPLGEELPLVIEPRYPDAEALMTMSRPARKPEDGAKLTLRNSFWSMSRRSQIMVWEEDGKIRWGLGTLPNQIGMLLSTVGAAAAWGIEQEARALQLLGTMLRHHNFKQYMLTGSFLESSPRSGVVYLFRRLRPTLALTMRGRKGTVGSEVRVLAALCLHPIGYYQGSWGGAMCPTDDVIAHLTMMRGDEAMFWRRANQHPSWRMEAGVS